MKDGICANCLRYYRRALSKAKSKQEFCSVACEKKQQQKAEVGK